MISSGFDFRPHTRLVFGNNSIERLGELARELGITRILVVTDPGIVAAGHVDRAGAALRSAGVELALFDRVRENPTARDVEACRDLARDERIDGLLGLGGGSSIDTARGANFLLTNGGRMHDYWGVGKATRPMLPLIAAPTTAGTGSECQSFALIADDETHQKMACGDPKAAARIALLDPTLTVSQPRHVTHATGIDAVAHAVESAVTRKRNAISVLFAREAFRLTAGALERVLEQPDDLESRARMQLGAAYAGLAIENSMLGAAHSAANPLTAHHGTVHGIAVGLMLPQVVRFNAAEPQARETYRDLAVLAGIAAPDAPAEEAVERLVSRLEALLRLGSETSAVPAGEVDVELLAGEAAAQWTARFNPREIGAAEFATLYRAVLGAGAGV
ncbi:MAG: iron-containing alcohol dehydrogenase [Armatimonadota bacterium]